MKALEKDRNRRYETANGFAADIQRLPGRRAGAGLSAVGRLPSPQIRPTEQGRADNRLAGRAVRPYPGERYRLDAGATGRPVKRRWTGRRTRRCRRPGNCASSGSGRRRWRPPSGRKGCWPGAAARNSASRVQQLRKDLEMVLHLDDIRLLASEWKEGNFDNEAPTARMRVPSAITGSTSRDCRWTRQRLGFAAARVRSDAGCRAG